MLALPSRSDLVRMQTTLCNHLRQVAKKLNAEFTRRRMGITVNARAAIEAMKRNPTVYKRFADTEDRSGVLHDEQIATAVEAMLNIIERPNEAGLIVGAMQSGKMTTALSLMFIGPVNYLVNGTKLFPIYLTTSQNGHKSQADREFSNFLDYYEELVFTLNPSGKTCSLRELRLGVHLDPCFEMNPTLRVYWNEVLRPARAIDWVKPSVDDLVKKRVRGNVLTGIVDVCKKMHAKGFVPLFIIDEPQWGAGSRTHTDVDGTVTERDCVLLQLVKALRKQIKGMGRNEFPRFVGTSATPYELGGIANVWQVHMQLGTNYRGFNWFNGRKIDPTATIQPPRMSTFAEMATPVGNPFLRRLRSDAYKHPKKFSQWAKRNGYAGSHAAYRASVEKALRDLLIYLVKEGEKQSGGPVGVCVRVFPDNQLTNRVLTSLNLPSSLIENVIWFGDDNRGRNIRDAIRSRQHRAKSFLVVVSAKARMGDAFPAQVRYFVDLTQRSTTQNALLQGLLGRACGYNKNTHVIMSDENTQSARAIANGVPYALTPSKNTTMVGGRAGTRDIGQVVLRRGVDAGVDRWFADIDAGIAGVVPPGATMKAKRSRQGRYHSIYSLSSFKHVEAAMADAVRRQRLLPEVAPAATVQIAKPGDQVARVVKDQQSGRDQERSFGFDTDSKGDVRFTFRRLEHVARGGSRGRGRGQRDGVSRTDALEPQLGMEKVDTAGKPIAAATKSGAWRVAAVALPLREVVRAGGYSPHRPLPTPACVYDGLLTKRERQLRDATA
jgi:hypothetical protein